jgi:hypothetical protein
LRQAGVGDTGGRQEPGVGWWRGQEVPALHAKERDGERHMSAAKQGRGVMEVFCNNMYTAFRRHAVFGSCLFHNSCTPIWTYPRKPLPCCTPVVLASTPPNMLHQTKQPVRCDLQPNLLHTCNQNCLGCTGVSWQQPSPLPPHTRHPDDPQEKPTCHADVDQVKAVDGRRCLGSQTGSIHTGWRSLAGDTAMDQKQQQQQQQQKCLSAAVLAVTEIKGQTMHPCGVQDRQTVQQPDEHGNMHCAGPEEATHREEAPPATCSTAAHSNTTANTLMSALPAPAPRTWHTVALAVPNSCTSRAPHPPPMCNVKQVPLLPSPAAGALIA